MKAPDLYLVVYAGASYEESIPIIDVVRRCGYTKLRSGQPLSAGELDDMGCFDDKNYKWFIKLFLDEEYAGFVGITWESCLDGNMVEVSVEDLKKSISYKRTDGGKGKGPGHFELSKLLSLPKYKNVMNDYQDWCIKWVIHENQQMQELAKVKEKEEEERIRKIFEEEYRKKREEEARIAEEKRIRENMIYIQNEREEERRWKESDRYKELEEEAYQRSLSWNGWGKDDYHDGGN